MKREIEVRAVVGARLHVVDLQGVEKVLHAFGRFHLVGPLPPQGLQYQSGHGVEILAGETLVDLLAHYADVAFLHQVVPLPVVLLARNPRYGQHARRGFPLSVAQSDTPLPQQGKKHI